MPLKIYIAAFISFQTKRGEMKRIPENINFTQNFYVVSRTLWSYILLESSKGRVGVCSIPTCTSILLLFRLFHFIYFPWSPSPQIKFTCLIL